jgi:lysozyme family protein
VARLTQQAAIDLYRARYWEPCRCDRMPTPVAVAVMDAAVQHGVRPAARMLQDVVGTERDGKIGPITLAATGRMRPADCLTGYCALRAVYYHSLGTFGKFGRGWMGRLFRLHATCLAVADPTQGGAP